MIRPHYVPLFESICHSEKLADLKGHGSRFFYTLVLAHCDSWGRAAARPRVLFQRLWSLYGTLPEVETMLADLARVKLIQRYTADSEAFLCIPDWEDKAGRVGQRDRRAPSEFPDPPDPSQGVDEGSQGVNNPSPGVARVARARPRAGGSAPLGSDLLGSEEGDAGEERKKAPRVEVEWWPKTFAEPEFESLNRPESLTAFRRLLETRTARRDSKWTESRLRTKLREFEPHGAAAWIAAVDATIGNGWQGTFPPGSKQNGVPSQPTGLAAVASMMRRGK